jgi:hypothetical protein
VFPAPVIKYMSITPPRAHGAISGEILALATSAVAASLNLGILFQQAPNLAAASGSQLQGVVDQELTIFAETSDLGVIFAPSQAAVTTGNAPVLATVGTVNGAGVYSAVAGTCYRIPAGQERRVLTQRNVDLWLGFVASAAGVMRLFQSSPATPTAPTPPAAL